MSNNIMEIRKAVILGATGATGKPIARELLSRAIKTRVVSRNHSNLERAFGDMEVERMVADLQDEEAARRAADSCDVVIHCVGLPVERFRDHIPISRHTISAMKATGAKGVLIGSFWSYGPSHTHPVSETHRREPLAEKERIRKEALNFRCLRYVRQPLDSFHVLVGPNASGKTTFLDVVGFLGGLVSDGLEATVGERTQNFQDLLTQRAGDHFELALEARIPEERRKLIAKRDYDTVRYEVSVGIDKDTKEVSILAEKALLKVSRPVLHEQRRLLFPDPPIPPSSLLAAKIRSGIRTIINKVPNGNDNFYSEVYGESRKGWAPAFKLGPWKSALGILPEDESKFPVTTWLKGLLSGGVQRFVLNSLLIRKASPPGQVRGFKPDGSNLPWVVENLQKSSPTRLKIGFLTCGQFSKTSRIFGR